MTGDDTLNLDSAELGVASLLERLPTPVRNFVLSKERQDIALALSQKHQLHVDQAGIFEHSFLLMLLGASTPTEFVAELREAGISDSVVTSITNDLNEQVFKKLRKEEEMMRPEPVVVETPTPQPSPVPPPVQPAPIAPPLPETPPLEPMRTMGTDMTRARETATPQYQQPYMPSYPQMPVQYVPFPGSYQPMPAPQTYWVPVQVPPPQYPYQQPQYAPPPPVPPQPVVQQPAPTPPAPIAQIEPEPAPAMPEVAAPVRPAPTPPPDLPTMQVSSAAQPTPLHKEYGVDPYHEPIQ